MAQATRTPVKCIPAPALLHRKAGHKKFLATLRFNLRRSRALPLIAALALLTPTIFLFSRLSISPVSRFSAVNHPHAYTDPCAQAAPQPLIHFDPPSHTSAELSNPVKGDVDPPTLHRVFTTFFKVYLFQMQPGHILNIHDAGRGRPTDIRDSLVHAQRALRTFYADDTIVVTNYSLGYNHLDRVHGSRYVFHLVSRNASNPARRDVMALQRTFDGRCFISVREYPPRVFDDPVYMVVPYSKRAKRLQWFLEQFDQLVQRNGGVKLILAVCKEIAEDVSVANRMIASMHNSQHARVVPVPGDRTGFFSRAVAIRDGSESVPKDSIMFVSDIDMYIFPPMLDSCRVNSIQSSQVYFPVFYSLYPGNSRIDKRAGYWRDSSFGMSCMYKSDFDAVGAYKKAETSFVGWGGEDDALFEAFRKAPHYEIFRAIEPALRHKWHVKDCEEYTPAYEDCLSVKFQQLGEMPTVGKLLLKKNVDAQKLFAQFADEEDSDIISRNRDGQKAPESAAEVQKRMRRKQMLMRNHELLKKRHAAREK